MGPMGFMGPAGLDGSDGQDSMIPGPQGLCIQGPMGPPGLDGQDGNDVIQLGAPPVVDPFIGSYAPGSFDIPDGKYAVMSNFLQLKGNDVARLEGTAQLRIT